MVREIKDEDDLASDDEHKDNEREGDQTMITHPMITLTKKLRKRQG